MLYNFLHKQLLFVKGSEGITDSIHKANCIVLKSESVLLNLLR